MADSSASFIPKNREKAQRRVGTTRRIYLLSYLSYVIFFGTLIAAVGTYFYAIKVKAELENSKTALEAARLQFNSADLDGVKSLEKRLLLAREFLDSSVSPSRIFKDVELIVAENIAFNAFKLEELPDKQYSVTLEGKVDDFNKILYQRELMNRSALLKDAKIVQYDYSTERGEEGDGASGLILPSGENDALITFVFSSTVLGSLFPYMPAAVSLASENIVTSVRGGDEGDKANATDASSADVNNTTP
jgi:hypothetical protein